MTKNSICKYEFKCLICPYYNNCPVLENQKQELLEAEKETKRIKELKTTIWWKCVSKNEFQDCTKCERKQECFTQREKELNKKQIKKYSRRNIIINTFPDVDKIEVLHYKTPFLYLEEAENLDPIERDRLLKLNKDGIYEPISDDFTIQALQRSIRNSSKRSLDSFYGYAMSNDWEYFVTLTFSPEKVDRYDINAVKELYSEFQRWCSRRSPDVKMLMIPEHHKKEDSNYNKALHFHGLISNITFNLEPYKDPKTGEYGYSKLGTPLFTIKDWKNGLSTLAIIPKEDNYNKVVNYMQKYVTKDGNIGYNQKRYYRTRNLNFKNKSLYLYNDKDIDELILSLGLEIYKDTNKMVVYKKKEK